jgi:hypothetical protein
MNNNWLQLLGTQRGPVLKNFLGQLLQERVINHDELIDRIASVIVTEKDMTRFTQMAMDLYEKGYLKSVQDHSEELRKMGVKVEIIPTKSPADSRIGLHE